MFEQQVLGELYRPEDHSGKDLMMLQHPATAMEYRDDAAAIDSKDYFWKPPMDFAEQLDARR